MFNLWLWVDSVLERLFHKILAKRMDTHLPLGERQKGFRPGDGIGLSVTLLREMLRKSTDLGLWIYTHTKALGSVMDKIL